MTATIQYPNHPDFDYTMEVERLRASRIQDWARQPWITLAVSQAWKDESWIEDFVDKLAAKYPKATMIVPARAMGAMKVATQRIIDHNLTMIEVRSENTWGTNAQAVQAGHMVKLSDIIMVAWAGGTDLPSVLVKKALVLHRPDEQFGHGLHVYEQTKTRATRSKKAELTGRVRYRIRKEFDLAEAA